jgi:hypothetical protein
MTATPTGPERARQKKQRLRDLIDRATLGASNPYTDHLGWVYAYGLLRELLIYSAENQMEVWQHLEKMERRGAKQSRARRSRTRK